MNLSWQGASGPLLIAEIGGNHEGDFDAALRLTDLAIEAGADVIKFQLYRGDSLVSAVEAPDRHRHFQRFELSPEQHIALAQRCASAGREYLASVWDPAMLAWIDPYLRRYKIGSGDLSAHALLRGFAARGKPIVLATGLSTLAEVHEAVAVLQAVDARYADPEFLCLLQCTSLYPTPPADVNLRAMDVLAQSTGLAVGYSHHCRDHLALRLAAARGAQVLEFHFTDRAEGREFRDHQLSLTAEQLVELRQDLARIEALLGQGTKAPTAGEIASGHVQSFRRAVYSRRAAPAGSHLSAADLLLLRPCAGIDAREFDRVPAHPLLTAAEPGAALQLAMPPRPAPLAWQRWPVIAQTPAQLIQQLRDAGHPADALQPVLDAALEMGRACAGLLRGSGKPFLCHLVGSAALAAEAGADLELVLACLLHASLQERVPAAGQVSVPQRQAWLAERYGGAVAARVAAYQASGAAFAQAVDAQALPYAPEIHLMHLCDALDDALDHGPQLHGRVEDAPTAPGGAGQRAADFAALAPQFALAPALGWPRLLQRHREILRHWQQDPWPSTLRTGAYSSIRVSTES